MVAFFSKCYRKIWDFFVLTQENALFRGFILKSTERSKVLLKNSTRVFKIALRLRDWHVFIWQSLEILNVFNTLSLKQNFLKKESLFQKIGVPFFN